MQLIILQGIHVSASITLRSLTISLQNSYSQFQSCTQCSPLLKEKDCLCMSGAAPVIMTSVVSVLTNRRLVWF